MKLVAVAAHDAAAALGVEVIRALAVAAQMSERRGAAIPAVKTAPSSLSLPGRSSQIKKRRPSFESSDPLGIHPIPAFVHCPQLLQILHLNNGKLPAVDEHACVPV